MKPRRWLIMRQVYDELAHGDGLLVADARTTRRRIENVAAHMGIHLTGHDTVLLRARSAVNYIEQKIDEAQAAGQLSWFNQAYRAWRLQANSTGAR
jgi:hypothetical protein